MDGTKIESAANKYTFVWKKSVEKNEKKLDEKVRELIEEINKIIDEENKAYGYYEPFLIFSKGQPFINPRLLIKSAVNEWRRR